MQANELRVGNIVRLNNPKSWAVFQGREFTIKSIQADETGKYYAGIELVDPVSAYENLYRDLSQYLEYLTPIPLTPEILEECGFVKTIIDRVVFWELEVGRTGKFQFYKGVMQFGVFGVANYEYHDVRPQHLYQLQNLYFSLTNTELTWNRKQ